MIAGLILAGGQGSRMGGIDKGLTPFRGKALVEHALERFTPQIDRILINANRSREHYEKLGHSVLPDALDGYAGPLAGLEVGLSWAQAQGATMLATIPCDSPFLPLDLVARLREALEGHDLAVATTHDGAQPVFALYRVTLLTSLREFLKTGRRKIDAWTAQHHVASVQFDDASAFANINTIDELNRFMDQPSR